MAHFAKLGIDNVVTNVVAVDNIDTMTRNGVESEEVGIAHLIKHHGHENWKKCSYNTSGGVHLNGGTPFRANYPSFNYTDSISIHIIYKEIYGRPRNRTIYTVNFNFCYFLFFLNQTTAKKS